MSVAGETTVSQQPQASTPLEILWANSLEVMFQADEMGRLLESNQAFSDLFGCPAEAARGREVVDFFEASSREDLGRRLKAAPVAARGLNRRRAACTGRRCA
jgi:PAS domain S-box-containing protein